MPASPAGDPPAQSAAPLQSELLPAPAELAQYLRHWPAPRSSSYVPADLLRKGEDFDSSLPHQSVVATATGAKLSSSWQPGDALSELAFAMYSYTIPDFEGDSTINYGWVSPPADSSSVFLGVSNWSKNRWDWFAAVDSLKLTLPSLDPYKDLSGNLLVTVLVTGIEEPELDRVRIGSRAPNPVFTATPSAGLIPLSVDFDASGSSDPDNSIVEYRWDPQGDGSFDQSSGADPHFQFEYANAGELTAAVRVINNKNVYADAVIEIAPLEQANFCLGSDSLADYALAAVETDDGHLLIFGEDDSSPLAVLIYKVSPTGELDMARSWETGSTNRLSDAALAPDGFVYACGSTSFGPGGGTNSNNLLQKWTQAGDLVWSRAIGQTGIAESFEALVIAPDAVYACGRAKVPAAPFLGLVSKLDFEGNQIWAQTVEGPADCFLADLDYHPGVSPLPGFVTSVGQYFDATNSGDALAVSFEDDGTLSQCQSWGIAGVGEIANAVRMSGSGPLATYIAGSTNVDNQLFGFVSIQGGNSIFLDNGTLSVLGPKLVLGGLGTISVVFGRTDLVSSDILLAGFDSSLVPTTHKLFSASPNGQCSSFDLANYGSAGLLIVGSSVGSLPSESLTSFGVATAAEFWSDFSPVTGALNMTTEETPIETADVSDVLLNSFDADDSDMYVCLTGP